MVSAMNGQKTRVRTRYYRCAAIHRPTPTPPPSLAKRIAHAAGWAADMGPWAVVTAFGTVLIVFGIFPQVMAVI